MVSSGYSRARVLAWLALAAVAGSFTVLAATSGASALLVVLVGVAGLAGAAAGLWLAVSRRGTVRTLGVLMAVCGPAAVLAVCTAVGLWTEALAALVLWTAGGACARWAVRQVRPPRPMRAVPSRPPGRPVLIMNPRSGGGKVGRFRLAERAEALGARVVLLDTSGGVRQDVTELARQAVSQGADLLGVAGGDGTQALVAEVAAEHGLPFLVLPAGTRNHFAMDLGLDRADPSRSLAALTDGEELRVDLGRVSGRPFVNTVSFGVYAQVVQSPEYRDAKAGTALEAMPDLLLGYSGARLDVQADDARMTAPQALLVSNNPYAGPQPLGGARRPRLDLGTLGVVGIRVENAAQAAELALRGTRATGLDVLTARRVTVRADRPTIPVAVDGEALSLPAPVDCEVRPGALRVLVPRDRPGVPVARERPDWRWIVALALGRPLPSAQTPPADEPPPPADPTRNG
ncbi:diacylglycerol/lipid kinase family protein [Kitasatospora sp. NPDC090091]|uniref:diacylglycerol/lipid kinase family protein n=1 Tax=Kitasatospora sp. NPDC090091 TaxID=3364081 RepID=UPI003821AF64